MYKSDNIVGAEEIQNKAIKAGIWLSMPAAVGIILLAQPIIHVIYERGAFTSEDTVKTAQAISAFALGLPAFVISRILMPVFYAHHDTKTPLKITIYSLSLNTILNIILMFPFGHVGIALGSSVAAWYNVWLLRIWTHKKHKFVISKDILIFLLQVIVACIIMAVVILLTRLRFEEYFYVNNILIKISALGGTIGLSAGAFLLTSLFFKLHKII